MDADSTRVIGQGTADYPLDPLSAQAEERCPHCAHSIPAGEQFCPHCGYQRGSWPAAAATGGASKREQEAGKQPTLPAENAPWLFEASDGATYPLPLGEWVIGRGAVDIVLPDSFASRSHARLAVSADGVDVTDLGSANGTHIGQRKLQVDEHVMLAAQDVLRVGQTDLKLVKVEEEPKSPEPEQISSTEEQQAATAAPVAPALEPAFMDLRPAGSPWLLLRGENIEFEIPYGTSSLGRKPDAADLVLRGDGFVSGLHARLVASLEMLEICDLGSTNGTYVNGERCEPSKIVQLKSGDNVRLGQTDLIVAFETQDDTGAEPQSENPQDAD